MTVGSWHGDDAELDRRFWATCEHELFGHLESSASGLTGDEAAGRLVNVRPSSPIVVLLIGATVLSVFLGDEIDAAIIFAIVVASAALGFAEERGAVHAVRALLGSVQVHADVVRDGIEGEVALEGVVPGDLVMLRAGDLVPTLRRRGPSTLTNRCTRFLVFCGRAIGRPTNEKDAEMSNGVVVGIDGSENSVAALRWNAAYAKLTGATVRAIIRGNFRPTPTRREW